MEHKIILGSEWIDKDTFCVYFDPIPTKKDFELEGVVEQVIAEWHADERKWVIDRQFYDSEGGFIYNDTKDFTLEDYSAYYALSLEEYERENKS